MSDSARNPSLYQIDTRVWLGELGRQAHQPLTFECVGDDDLDRFAALGFDWLWPMGVWQTGLAGRGVSRTHPEWRKEFEATLPDLTEDDITGSPYAVQAYTVHSDFGGADALDRFRQRLRRRGMKLLLDFVPNHTALDHPWVWQHPEYYVPGDDGDLAREPQNYVRVETRHGPQVLAHGRDPYFPGWPDTLQLNYRCAALRRAMVDQLASVAEKCDGVRFDMAMLLLPDVIGRTWGERSRPADGSPPVDIPFWPEAIGEIRERFPDFLFMAEVYWDLEWVLQQQGFNYTYDKRLYDRLLSRSAESLRGHLQADLDFQRKSVRFLENHDERRAADAFPPDVHRAAAVIAFLVPGMRFFHEGQFKGRRKHVSIHLGRWPTEPVDKALEEFYMSLVEVVQEPLTRDGNWRMLDARSARDGDPTGKQPIAFLWEGREQQRLLVVVNYGPSAAQAVVSLPVADLSGGQWLLRDRLGPARYERAGSELVGRGLYLDLPAWGYHVFEVVGA
jgi:glycosidase